MRKKTKSTKSAENLGRPVGSVQTPTSLAMQEMKACIKSNGKVRDLMNRLIAMVEEELAKPETSVEQKLAIVEMLAKVLGAQAGIVEKIGKHLLVGKSAEAAKDEEREKESGSESVEDILAALKKG